VSEAYAEPIKEAPEAVDEDAPAKQANAGFIQTAPQSANLAFDIDDTTLAQMGDKVCEEFDIDMASRKDAQFEERVERAVKLATMAQEAKNTPWENASNVKYPLVIQAAIQFNARSYPAVIDGAQVVKGAVKGAPSPEKAGRADRIGKHMSWQVLDEEEEWEEDTDALLLRLSIVGTLVRKTYFDPSSGRNCSHVLGPDEFVVNYRAKRDLSLVPRATHVLTFYPHEIIEKRRSGLWLDVELGDPAGAANDDAAPHTFLEQHRLWDLDEDGYPEPYVVTVHKESRKVVRVVARWYEEDVKLNDKGEVAQIRPYECFTKYGFIPNPDGSFYDIGFGTLLGSTSDTINTVLNQLLDAATLANLQGGFIGEGVSVKSGALRFKPGEWKKAQTTGGNLRENIVPLPTKEPSSVLYQLMVFLIESSRELTATQEILTGDAGKSSMPVGTTLALIEQGLKTFTAIVKRIHRALKREMRIRYRLNARYLQPEAYFTFQDQPLQVIREDYAQGDMDIVPVTDPNMATDMQRMGRAQFLMGLAGPDMDVTEIKKFAMETAGIQEPERFLPKGPPQPPPELLVKQKELELKEREVAVKENTAAADIEKKIAEATATNIQNFMASPQFAEMLSAAVRMGAQQALELVSNGQPAPVRPADVPGMEVPPADGPVPPIPGGPAPAVDAPMGGGGFDDPGSPMPGAPPAGAGFAGVG
jgi:chaperonin GroES